MFLRSRLSTAWPASRDEAALRWSTLGSEADPGRDRPRASPMDDMVFAVNIPPHEPEPGHALFSIAVSSSASIWPVWNWPMASNTFWIWISSP